MWFVYAIYNSVSGKIYIGETSNLERRLREHNLKRGNHFTAKGDGDWKIIYKEEVDKRQEALKREKQLKTYKGREFVRKLITVEA